MLDNSQMSDEQLVEAFQAGHLAAYDELVSRWQSKIRGAVWRVLGSTEDAADITQEAFLRLWKEWEKGAVIDNPRAWLMRVARNLAEDYAKSAFHRNGTLPPQQMNGVKAPEWSPLENLEREEKFAQLHAILQELSEADRQLLALRYALDCDATEIAQILGVNTTAVHMRLSRARQRLAERLPPEMGGMAGMAGGNPVKGVKPKS